MNPTVNRALGYLRKQQEPDGGFVGFSSAGDGSFTDSRIYRTTFGPSIMLHALRAVDAAQDIRDGLSRFLLAERSSHWSFNYWTRSSRERQTLPYPDDLDDTFCALIALHGYDPKLVDATALAHIVKLLLATEIKPGGPYRTWLVPKNSEKVWLDVDLAVNANVAYFLSLVGSPLPSLADYIDGLVKQDRLTSRYYPSIYPILYYVSRAYSGEQKMRLVRLLRTRQRAGHWGTPLHTALAMASAGYLGADVDLNKARRFLQKTQAPDGSWPAESICIDPTRDAKEHYHGSPALTTALAIEALWQTPQPSVPKVRPARADRGAERLYKKVSSYVRMQLDVLGADLGSVAKPFLERMLAGDKNQEIVLLPYFYYRSLEKSVPIPEQTLIQLGAANLYGWIAYTIYDNFLDEEGDVRLLPVANVAMRSSLACFSQALPDDAFFHQLVAQTFTVIDQANAWEVARCRFLRHGATMHIGVLPRYGNRSRLAGRSLGHTLTPLAVLTLSGQSSREVVRATQRSLQQYLIARQLSDDLHDWEQDFRAGHASFVVTSILRELRIAPGPYNIDHLVRRMQRQFWNHTLPRLCAVVGRHIDTARPAAVSGLRSANVISKLLVGIEASMDSTLMQQAEAKQFLDSYKGI